MCVFVSPKTHQKHRVHMIVFAGYSPVHTKTLEYADTRSRIALIVFRDNCFGNKIVPLCARSTWSNPKPSRPFSIFDMVLQNDAGDIQRLKALCLSKKTFSSLGDQQKIKYFDQLNSRQVSKLESKEVTRTSVLSTILYLSLQRRLDLSSRDVNDVSVFKSLRFRRPHCTESDAYSKRCVFKWLHFRERFQMFTFSMKKDSVFGSF